MFLRKETLMEKLPLLRKEETVQTTKFHRSDHVKGNFC